MSIHNELEKILLKLIKVAKYSFQALMPNSPLLVNYLCFGTSFLQESTEGEPQKYLFSHFG